MRDGRFLLALSLDDDATGEAVRDAEERVRAGCVEAEHPLAPTARQHRSSLDDALREMPNVA